MDRNTEKLFSALTDGQLAAIRTAYIEHVPLKEIAQQFGLARWQLAALTRQFRAEADIGRRRPRLAHNIEKIVLPTRQLARDGGGWHYGSITLPRNSMHVQVLRERGYAEI